MSARRSRPAVRAFLTFRNEDGGLALIDFEGDISMLRLPPKGK